jgi:hydroxymethylglutaryl-CoA reductase
LKILGAKHASDLARICAAVGLVQNLGALKALSTVGIVKGHMQLHAANLAIAAGAEVHEVAEVRERLAAILKVEKTINLTRAREILVAVRAAAQTRAHAGETAELN